MSWLARLVGAESREPSPPGVPPETTSRKPFSPLRVLREKKPTVFVIVPRRLEDACKGAEALLEGSAVIVNLQHIEPAKAQRILDVLGGVSFACKGSIYEVGKRLYLFLPAHVAAEGDDTTVRAVTRLFAGLTELPEGHHEIPSRT